MTKSEARAIHESCARTLRVLEGVDMPWIEMSTIGQVQVRTNLRTAIDETTRVYEMAKAELGKDR